jgi:hypothetical protein
MLNCTPTVVSMSAIYVASIVLVEFSDGSVREYRCHQAQSDSDLRSFRFQTHEQLVEICRGINYDAQQSARHNLHMDKVRRLGQDYARRGY